jgi:hypothetical protein
MYDYFMCFDIYIQIIGNLVIGRIILLSKS